MKEWPKIRYFRSFSTIHIFLLHILVSFSSRKYGVKCATCKEGITPQSVVRKAQEHVYHLHCFKCVACQKEMTTGDEFYLLPQDGKLVCKFDYDMAKNKGII